MPSERQLSDLGLRESNGSLGTISAVGLTGNPGINGLLRLVKWNGPITYSAPDALGDYQMNYFTGTLDGQTLGAFDTNNFSAFSSRQMIAFHYALDAQRILQPAGASGFSVEGFTLLDITFLAGGSGGGTIRGSNMDEGNNTAFGYYPSNTAYGGDTFFGNYYDTAFGGVNSLKNPIAGNYAWHTMIHELGHTLGLKHGHEAAGVINPNVLPAAKDSVEFSVMTYRAYIGQPSNAGYSYEKWGAPQSWMMFDIAALQTLYGADYSANAGRTTYKWTPSSGDTKVNGKMAIDAGGNRIFATVWDGGGIDTYDLSAYTTNLKIDLKPGGFSTFSATQLAYLGGGPNKGFARGNIFNALLFNNDPRSLIENATGGRGNDSIYGNIAANVLNGKVGNDKLYGLVGADTLIGGPGKDTMVGGLGNDVFKFTSRADSPGGALIDIITDFDKFGNDRIDVSALFGPKMSFIRGAEFSKLGQVRIENVAGPDVIVEINFQGSLDPDFQIRLKATTFASMTASDFIL